MNTMTIRERVILMLLDIPVDESKPQTTQATYEADRHDNNYIAHGSKKYGYAITVKDGGKDDRYFYLTDEMLIETVRDTKHLEGLVVNRRIALMMLGIPIDEYNNQVVVVNNEYEGSKMVDPIIGFRVEVRHKGLYNSYFLPLKFIRDLLLGKEDVK